MCLSVPAFAWQVTVTSNPNTNDPIVTCLDAPVTISFTAQATNQPPTSTEECTATADGAHWSGDVNDASQSVTVPATQPGSHTVTAHASIKYTFESAGPLGTVYVCPGDDEKTGDKTVTVVVLTDEVGQYTPIHTPAFTQTEPAAQVYDDRPITEMVGDPESGDYTYREYKGRLRQQAGPAEKHGWNYAACSETTTIDDSWTAGIDVESPTWHGITFGFEAAHEVTSEFQLGESGVHRRYRAQLWIPSWVLNDELDSVELVTVQGGQEISRQNQGSSNTALENWLASGGADWATEGACCPG
jgi:hypothetical protein